MASTPNFNWSTPDNTGLVKNGALDIRTLGNSIDASMADLKGGTTGQVLAKATNTDMDFAWVAQDDSNAIQNAIVDAKGDLIGATAADTPARLAVGTNGQVLTADSSAATGLAWAAPASGYADNGVLNSAMQCWQRGTSFSSDINKYTADRWMIYRGVTTSTISRQLTGDTTNLPNIQYALRFQRNSGTTSTATSYLSQSFETLNSIPFAGKTVTFSFYARKGADFSAASSQILVKLVTGTGTDQNVLISYTGLATPIDSTATLTTTWQRFTYTATLSSSMTEMNPYFQWDSVGTAGTNDYVDITGVMVEVGSTASAFHTNQPTIQAELAACQRYLPSYDNTAGTNNGFVSGYAYGTNSSIFIVPFDVAARVSPTGVTVSGTMNAYALNVNTAVTPTFDAGGINSAAILASHTITAGQGARLGITSGAKLLFTGCEL